MNEDAYHKNDTGANISGLTSGSSVITLGLASAAVLQLLISIILSRYLGNEGIGLIALVTRYVSIVSIVVMLGLPPVITHLVAANSNSRKKSTILSTALTVLLVSSLAAMFILVLTASLVASLLNNLDLGLMIVIQTVGLPLTVSSVTISSHIRGLMRFRGYALLQFSGPASNLLFALVFILLQILTPSYAIVAGVLGSGTTAFIAVLLTKSLDWTKPDRDLLRPILIMSLPLLIVGLGGTVIDSIDILLLRIVGADLGAIGAYSNAFMLSTYLRYMIEPVALSLLPIASSLLTAGKVKETQAVFNVGVRLIANVFIPLVLLVAISSTNILLLLYPVEFAIASSSLSILTIGSVGLALYYLSSRLLIAQADTWTLGALIAAISIIDVFLTFVLAIGFGIVGAAVSSAMTFTLMGILTSLVLKKRTGLSVSFRAADVRLWTSVAIANTIVLLTMNSVFGGIPYDRPIALLAAIAVTLLTLFLIKPLSLRDADVLLSLIHELSMPEAVRKVLERTIRLMQTQKKKL